MHISLNTIERESGKNSPVHRIDPRIKLIMTLILIVYAVYTTDFLVLFLVEMYIISLVLSSKISIKYYIKRVIYILPFGGFIAIFQPFIKPGIILYTLPFSLTISYEGIMFGLLLFSRLVVCLSAIVLFSSVTSVDKIGESMRKLGFPKELSMILSMTIRYLFVFFEELENIRNAQKSRCFNLWNRKTKYLWRIKQIGYTIMMLFLKSFEKGEKVYFSMLSRGYQGEPTAYQKESHIKVNDYVVITITVAILVVIQLIQMFQLI